jgi:predicted ATPase
VVVLEDLHWADPDTVAAVEYVADNVGNLPVVCIVTARSEPPSPALALARRQRGKGEVMQLLLDRLDPEQTAMMIRACTPEATADLVARVQRDAEGVPLLVEDVLASPGVPRSFADTVRERLGGLTPAERAVIEAAAVLGRDFRWELLAPMTSQSADSVSGGLARGVDCLLLAASGGTVRFRHALTREAVLDQVLPPRHRQLAAAALAALDAAYPAGEGWRDLAADLAARSGDQARAGSLLTVSGEASLRRGALATAIGTLQQAADLLEHQKERSRCELVLLEAMTLVGRVDEAAALGARLTGRLGSDPSTLDMRVEVHLRLAQAAVAASRWQMARHSSARPAAWPGATRPPPWPHRSRYWRRRSRSRPTTPTWPAAWPTASQRRRQ